MATYAKLLQNSNGDTILPYTRDSLVYTSSNVPLDTVNVLCDNSESVPTTTSETVKTNEELTQIVTSGTVNKATTAASATTAGYATTSVETSGIVRKNVAASDTLLGWVGSARNGATIFQIDPYYFSDAPVSGEGVYLKYSDEGTARQIVFFYQFNARALYKRDVYSGGWLNTWVLMSTAISLSGSTLTFSTT